MGSDGELEKPGQLQADWINSEKGAKDEEAMPLLDNTQEETRQQMLKRFLFALLECCCSKFFKKNEEEQQPVVPSDDVGVRSLAVTTPPRKLGDIIEADEEVQEVVMESEEGITDKLILVKGGEPGDFTLTILSYRKQVTVGSTYYAKIKLNDGPECIHARIFKPVEGPASVIGDLLFDKTESDDIEYF